MERRVRFSQQEVAEIYRFPLERTILTATSDATAQVIGEIRPQSIGEVARLVVGNQTGTSADVSVLFVPEGETAGAQHREVTAVTVAGNENLDLTRFIGGLYAPNTEIRAYASTANALIIMGYVEGRL